MPLGAREMVQWLNALVALAKDPGPIPSPHEGLTIIPNSRSKGANALF